MILVDLNSYGVTNAGRENPILKTIGLRTCVGVTFYEPSKKLAGLFHITIPLDIAAEGVPLWQSVQEDILALLGAMQKNGLTSEDRKTWR